MQSCTRTLREPMTIMGVAGHMHLLGRSIKIEVNPGTDRAQTVLDIPVWDFDNQGAKPIKPVHLDTWDTVKVTCEHVQWLRDQLPVVRGPGRSGTSCGARAPPTRCAWASCRSRSPDPTSVRARGHGRITRWAPRAATRNMEGLTQPTGRAARLGHP